MFCKKRIIGTLVFWMRDKYYRPYRTWSLKWIYDFWSHSFVHRSKSACSQKWSKCICTIFEYGISKGTSIILVYIMWHTGKSTPPTWRHIFRKAPCRNLNHSAYNIKNHEQKCWSWAIGDKELKTNTARAASWVKAPVASETWTLPHPLPCNKAQCWTKRRLLQQCESILPVPSTRYRANISLIPIMTQHLPAITALLMHKLFWCSNRQV